MTTTFHSRPTAVEPSAGPGGFARSEQDATTSDSVGRRGHGEVQLWFAPVDSLDDTSLADACRRLMAPEECVRHARLHCEEDRNAFLMARALLRTTLSRHAAVAPQDWRFEFNRYGKPSIADCHAEARHLRFNLSYTRSLVVMALGRAGALGIDVEARRPKVDLAVADHFFSEREAAALRRLEASERLERFVELWTLKECFVKASGAGLSMPLDGFSFDLDTPGRIELLLTPSIADVTDRWSFVEFDAGPEHRVALCVERAEPPLSLRLTRCVPLRGEWPADWPITRRSVDDAPGSHRA